MFSKTKTNVFANTYQLAEANPNAVKENLIYSILSNTSIVEGIQNMALNSIDNRVGRFTKYAQEKYTLGLPEYVLSNTAIIDISTIEGIVAAEVNAPYGIHCSFGYVSPLYLHQALLPFLNGVRKINLTTNIVGNPPDGIEIIPPSPPYTSHDETVVTIFDIELGESDNVAIITYRVATNSIRFLWGDHEDYKKVTEEKSFYMFTETINITPNLQLGRLYCIVTYYHWDSEGLMEDTPHWWYYDISSLRYPDLDLTNIEEESNDLFPVIPIRYNNEDLTREAVRDTELYKTSKKLLKIIDIDINDIAANINESPDVAEVDHAYMMFGINLQTENTACIKYLYEFFDYLAAQASINFYQFVRQKVSNDTEVSTNVFSLVGKQPKIATVNVEKTDWAAIDQTEGVSTATTITNVEPVSFTEHGLNIDIDFSYIRKDAVIETIGKPGTVTIEKQYNHTPVTHLGPFAVSTYKTDKSCLILKKQKANGVCQRLIITGLVHRNRIYKEKTVTTTLSDVIQDAEENNFVIPLHYGISQKLEKSDREQIYTESMVLVLNSIVKTKLKWYQRGFFKFIVMVVVVFVSCWSGQYYLAKLGETFAAAVAAGKIGAWAVLMMILPDVIIGMLLSTALNFVVDRLGPRIGAILAAVVIILAAAKGRFDKAFSFLNKLTAKQLVGLANGILSATGKKLEAMIGDIASAYDEFLVESKEKIEKLQKAQDLLQLSDLSIDLLEAQTSRNIERFPGTPTEFYDLRIHSGNIGTLALDIPQHYHTIALTLPKSSVQF